MKKQSTFKGLEKPGTCFGGSLLKGNNPNGQRPLESKLPIHLILKAKESRMRLPKHFGKIGKIVDSSCKRHGVKVYEYANVGNHLHLLIKIRTRRSWAAFIRELTGRIALATKIGWLYRPYTRIVGGWRKAFQTMKEYIHLNWLEAEGFINRKQTKTLKDLRAIWGG